MEQQNHLKNKPLLIPCWNRNFKLIHENPLGMTRDRDIKRSEGVRTLQYDKG